MTIAEKIKYLRKENNMTQEELAIKIQVSRQTISKWETGVVIPDIDHIVSLCKIFHVTTDDILDYQNSKIIKRKQFIVDMIVLLFGIIGFIVFGILLFTNQIDHTSSTITINAYGIASIVFLVVVIAFVIIMFKRNVKK